MLSHSDFYHNQLFYYIACVNSGFSDLVSSFKEYLAGDIEFRSTLNYLDAPVHPLEPTRKKQKTHHKNETPEATQSSSTPNTSFCPVDVGMAEDKQVNVLANNEDDFCTENNIASRRNLKRRRSVDRSSLQNINRFNSQNYGDNVVFSGQSETLPTKINTISNQAEYVKMHLEEVRQYKLESKFQVLHYHSEILMQSANICELKVNLFNQLVKHKLLSKRYEDISKHLGMLQENLLKLRQFQSQAQ